MGDENSESKTGLLSCFFPSNKTAGATTPTPTPSSAQTPYVPQHAKDSFLKTATPRQMKKANEIL
ncbi:hypothetical protein K449DRAFT_432711 [Hypoxylon sp. EC38]|nr:hypothetical protein K449DRAFT_432711 [Hypoxylon sp. EC38]